MLLIQYNQNGIIRRMQFALLLFVWRVSYTHLQECGFTCQFSKHYQAFHKYIINLLKVRHNQFLFFFDQRSPYFMRSISMIVSDTESKIWSVRQGKIDPRFTRLLCKCFEENRRTEKKLSSGIVYLSYKNYEFNT